MVLYTQTVPFGKPWLSEELFRTGFPDSETATILVGPEKKKFNFPLTHICSISHFDRAFNGQFAEAESRNIALEDEDPDAFLLFTEWLYRGFPGTNTTSTYSFMTWTKFYLMLDKWIITSPLPGISKQIWNLVTMSSLCTGLTSDALDEALSAHCQRLKDCYRLTESHALRMLFVHAAHQMNRWWWPARMIGDMPETSFDTDLARWMHVLVRTTDKPATWIAQNHYKASEGSAHGSDLLLMPLLHDGEAWPSYTSALPQNWMKQRGDERTYWRGFLQM